MPRQRHKKSRGGCLECKRRHIKCDERQPICSNCTASERRCEYGTRVLSVTPRSPFPGRVEQAQLSPDTPIQSPSGASFPDQPANMLHVSLFHNLYTQTRHTFDPTGSLTWLTDLINNSITTPYLANAMLAFSALHMSTTSPQREFYRYHAAQLQTHALSIFKESNPPVSRETCVPLFLFATVVGIHTLCDTLIYRDGTLPPFLHRFVHFFRLYHGIRAILTSAWDLIESSPLAPALNMGKDLYTFTGHLGPQCTTLLDLIKNAKLGKETTDIYRQAIESLQSCFNAAEGAEGRHAGINAVTTWSILLRVEFGDLLEQGRPEALVALAYWATLLHRFRDSWVFGDSGRFIIEGVGGYLGGEWEEWMRWPNEVLRGDQ